MKNEKIHTSFAPIPLKVLKYKELHQPMSEILKTKDFFLGFTRILQKNNVNGKMPDRSKCVL